MITQILAIGDMRDQLQCSWYENQKTIQPHVYQLVSDIDCTQFICITLTMMIQVLICTMLVQSFPGRRLVSSSQILSTEMRLACFLGLGLDQGSHSILMFHSSSEFEMKVEIEAGSTSKEARVSLFIGPDYKDESSKTIEV
ncbi:hypothetical protein RRG08_058150 [Elysia crispata]|uniref:Uncharacterized protein n=1 Tax=Elysia crispata TaxID=231223 RepID=A0AAE0Y1M2_9GAST|nr:hypothetical protein RRG08_058150 [Elysia crispata]